MKVRSPLVEVAKSYVQRPILWLGAMLYALIGGFVLHQVLFQPHVLHDGIPRQWGLLGQLLVATLVFTAYLFGHLKEQIARATAHVTPHYRGPHLMCGALIMAVMVWLIPCMIGSVVGVSMVGTAAMFSVLHALALWTAHTYSLTLLLTCIGIYAFGLTRHGWPLLEVIWSGNHPGVAVALALAGLGGFVILGIHLWHLREESGAYRYQLLEARERTMRRLAGGRRSWVELDVSQWSWSLTAPSDAALRTLGAGAEASWWRRVQRRRVGIAWRGIDVAGLAGAMFILSGFVRWTDPTRPYLAWPIAGVFAVMAAFRVIVQWYPTLGSQMLWPVTRRGFFLESAGVLLCETLRLWAALHVGLLIPTLWGAAWSAWPEVLWPGVLSSLALTWMLLWVLVWLARYGPQTAAYLLMGGLLALPGLSCMGLGPFLTLRSMSWQTLDAGLLMVGAVVMFDAGRRWITRDVR